jgi:hypothetical protein
LPAFIAQSLGGNKLKGKVSWEDFEGIARNSFDKFVGCKLRISAQKAHKISKFSMSFLPLFNQQACLNHKEIEMMTIIVQQQQYKSALSTFSPPHLT